MAERQKPWDQYEAVVLLEGFLDILSNNFSRNEVIDRVSHDLRTMAINQGYEIDDVFRNKNGIKFQIKSMESAYLGYTVMKPASRLFAETVALYRNSPSEYEKMRKEAREMIEGNKEKKFMDHLTSQVSHALFVELSSDASNITEQPVADSVKPVIGSNSPTASTEPKILSLEEMVREALRAETEGNTYGTTVSFLQGNVRGGNREKIKAILDSAEWAKFQFGRYYYVSKEAPVTEANDRTAVAPDNPAMPIERTDVSWATSIGTRYL